MKSLQFRVGLTSNYKPDEELLKELLQPPKPAVHVQDEKESQSDLYEGDEGDDRYGIPIPTMPSDVDEMSMPEEPQEDPSIRQFTFSLSDSLNLLFEERFLETLQLRLCFGIGWSAAELLISRAERAQRKPEAMYDRLQQVYFLSRLNKFENGC